MKAKPPVPTPATPPAKKPALDPLEWIEATQAQPDILQAMERRQKRSRRRRRQALGTAATLLAVAAFFWFSPAPSTQLPAPSSAVVHLPIRQILPDGSVVELNDGAVIREAFTADQRRVELLGGEAHFTVTKNPTRPFVVAAGGVEFRAVGTAFSVDLRQREVEMVVTEGSVSVGTTETNQPSPGLRLAGAERLSAGNELSDPSSQHPAPSPQSLASSSQLLVTAGERVVVELAAEKAVAPVEVVDANALRARMAWRVPRLEFSGTRLEDAIPMINEYSKVKLVLADEALGDVRLSGILRADNIDALRELLAEVHGIRSEYRAAGEIVLERKRER